MNQTKMKLLTLLLALGLVLGSGTWVLLTHESTEESPAALETSTTETGRTEILYLAQPGVTSLEQLREEASQVITEESAYGTLVTSIEGHAGGTEGKYWSFYVNDEMAQVGADSYIQQEGDWIEWKFQKL